MSFLKKFLLSITILSLLISSFGVPQAKALAEYQFATETIYSDGYDYTKEQLNWGHNGEEEVIEVLPLEVEGAKVGTFDLAIDSQNHAHIVLEVYGVGYQYVTNESGAWVYTTLHTLPSYQGIISIEIELDSDDNPHVLVSEAAGLIYWAKMNGTWHTWHISSFNFAHSDFTVNSQGDLDVLASIEETNGSLDRRLFYGHFYGADKMIAHPFLAPLGAMGNMAVVDSTEDYSDVSLTLDEDAPVLSGDTSVNGRNTGVNTFVFDASSQTWIKNSVGSASTELLGSQIDLNGDVHIFVTATSGNHLVEDYMLQGGTVNLYAKFATSALNIEPNFSEILLDPITPDVYLSANGCFNGTCETYEMDNSFNEKISTVDYVTSQGYSKSILALSPAGSPYLLYLDFSQPNLLKFASPEQVPLSPSANTDFESPSIQTDSAGNPFIAVRSFATANNVTTGSLRLISYAGGTQWTTEIVDSYGNTGLSPDLYIDSNNAKYITYYQESDGNSTTGDLYFASTCGGTSWINSEIDGNSWGSIVGEYSAVAVDSQGVVHVMYYDQTNGALKYAYSDGTCRSNMQWQTEVVEQGQNGRVGEYVDMVMDTSGILYFSYYDGGSQNLKYGYGQSGAWKTYTLDSSDDNGKYSSIVRDSQGDIMISYYSETKQALRFITNKKLGAATAMYAGFHLGWTPMTVDENGVVGMDNSLGLSASGYPIISYYDASNRDLKIAFFNGQQWVTEVKDGLYDATGLMTTLFVDGLGVVHVSYIDSMDGLFYMNF